MSVIGQKFVGYYANGMWLICFIALQAQSPEQRAVDYLAKEVPRWSPENGCFSCHNNGDGARALFAAIRLKYRVPREALLDTQRWLSHPARWDANRGNPAFSDKKLARIQFAAALAGEWESGILKERSTLVAAAESLVALQDVDGSWQIDAGAAVGSPATWGPALATYMARRILVLADTQRFARSIESANSWFRKLDPKSVPDAAAILLARQGERALPFLINAQNGDGGWGPRLHAPSEPFDTAIAVLALADGAERGRGRKFLIAAQQESGGWPETTRPPGGQSYAQQISTSAWATLALLASVSHY